MAHSQARLSNCRAPSRLIVLTVLAHSQHLADALAARNITHQFEKVPGGGHAYHNCARHALPSSAHSAQNPVFVHTPIVATAQGPTSR